MKRNLAVAILLVIAAIHLAVSLSVVPEGNRLFLWRYDTGYQPTKSGANNLRLACLLSFPLALWVWMVHPARMNGQEGKTEYQFERSASMKRQATLLYVSLFTIGGIVILLSGCTTKRTEPSPVERGKYLVTAGGCIDCHSPKVFTAAGPAPDEAKLLSGYPANIKLPEIPKGILGPAQWGAITTNDMTAWVGSWGVSFSYNLTPHPATGIGNWDEALFIQTIRTGKFMGTSRNMLPPMPWQEIGKMTDDDLKAMFAYLKSLPPIDNAIPAPLPPSQQ